jgi:hypothetical protein
VQRRSSHAYGSPIWVLADWQHPIMPRIADGFTSILSGGPVIVHRTRLLERVAGAGSRGCQPGGSPKVSTQRCVRTWPADAGHREPHSVRQQEGGQGIRAFLGGEPPQAVPKAAYPAGQLLSGQGLCARATCGERHHALNAASSLQPTGHPSCQRRRKLAPAPLCGSPSSRVRSQLSSDSRWCRVPSRLPLSAVQGHQLKE